MFLWFCHGEPVCWWDTAAVISHGTEHQTRAWDSESLMQFFNLSCGDTTSHRRARLSLSFGLWIVSRLIVFHNCLGQCCNEVGALMSRMDPPDSVRWLQDKGGWGARALAFINQKIFYLKVRFALLIWGGKIFTFTRIQRLNKVIHIKRYWVGIESAAFVASNQFLCIRWNIYLL